MKLIKRFTRPLTIVLIMLGLAIIPLIVATILKTAWLFKFEAWIYQRNLIMYIVELVITRMILPDAEHRGI